MAEAHSAVAFTFSVTHEGVNVDVNHEALKAVFKSGLRSIKKSMGRIKVLYLFKNLAVRVTFSGCHDLNID